MALFSVLSSLLLLLLLLLSSFIIIFFEFCMWVSEYLCACMYESVRKCLSAHHEQQSNIELNSCRVFHCKSQINDKDKMAYIAWTVAVVHILYGMKNTEGGSKKKKQQRQRRRRHQLPRTISDECVSVWLLHTPMSVQWNCMTIE